MTDDLAARLLEAQIAFMRQQLLTAGDFARLVVEEIDHFLDDASRLTLGEVVTTSLIQDTAHKYAVQMPLEGAIPELVGEIAARLYRHRVNDEVHVGEVIDGRGFDEIVGAVAEMDVVDRVAHRILTDPTTEDIVVEVVVNAIDTAMTRGGEPAGGSGAVGVLLGGLARVARPALPVVEAGVERATRLGARFVLGAADEEGDLALVDAAREVWRRHAHESVGVYRELVTADDVEDAVVVVFEFWKSFLSLIHI